jgi:hypothetical protein
MRIIEGQLIARDVHIVILAARFNDLIVRNLVDGAVDALKRHGAGGAASRQAPALRWDCSPRCGDPGTDAALRFRLQ